VGWVRARNYAGGRGWTINLPDLLPHNVARACAFVRRLYGIRDLDFTPVRLDTSEGVRRVEVADLQSLRVFHDGQLPVLGIPLLIFVENASHIPLGGIPKVELLATDANQESRSDYQ
jgi:hypothetical protein